MYRWMKKAGLVVGATALVLGLFAASMIPGVAGVSTAQASFANQVELTQGSDYDAPAKRGGKGHLKRSGDDDDGGFGMGGRRSRGD